MDKNLSPSGLGLSYVIHKRYDNESYSLSTPEGTILKKLYNGAKLKRYYYRSGQSLGTHGASKTGEEMIPDFCV